MPIELLIVLPGVLLLIAALIATVVMATRLGPFVRLLAVLLLVPLACFSAFGFMASFEPGDFHLAWRVAYAVVFLACLIGALQLLLARRQP